MALRAALTAAIATLALAPGARAQPDIRPNADWRTVETAHFVVHYPAEMAAWTEPMASRLEAIHAAVTAATGYDPPRRTTVLVDDPSNQPNGVSFGPVIYLWPTPPDPSSGIGENRGWGELLAVHEFVHSSHLTRPSRNPRDRLLYGLLPFPVEPIAVRSPRWIREGYATYLEGRLTGGGRPNGVWRPAVLRTRALAGALPTYRGLDRTEGYWEGSMAYLVGSAYVEWLVSRSGEESLPDLWARMTARRRRSFEEAFTGVFGGPPAELYGEFQVDLTGKAVEARQRLESAGLVEGERFQRLDVYADDPAVSPDGSRLAVTLRPAGAASRIVVWSTEPDTAAARREREALLDRLRAADPEDVPPVEWRPRPRKPLATLGPVGSRGHRAARFLPDGERILVVRSEGLGDGRARPDLFEWTWRTGALRRITHGAGIRSADPTADGRSAIGVRCRSGICDVVRIDLSSGAVEDLAPGEPESPFFRPRVSPDGTTAVVGVQRGGRTRIALVDLSSGSVRDAGPDDGASRFDPAWLADGSLVAVSDAGGVHDLERIDPAEGTARPLTRVVGAALGPTADRAGGSIWFLTLESHGSDVRRMDAASPALERVPLDPALFPAAPAPVAPPEPFAAAPLPPARAYGLGPRGYSLLPFGSIAPDGLAGGATLASADPVGRLLWTLNGLVGGHGAWRGVAGEAALRRFRPALGATAFAVRHEPSEQDDGAPAGLDADYAGVGLGVSLERDFLSRVERFAIGGSAGRLDITGGPDGTRAFAYARASIAALATPGPWRLSGSIDASGAAGSTAGDDWTRTVAGLALRVGRGPVALSLETRGGWTGGGPPAWETFAVGGVTSPLVDPGLLSQRLPLPAVPVGYVAGETVGTVRIAARAAGIAPFWWAGSAGEEIGDWKRVVGVEWVVDQDRIPYLGLPHARFEAGLARALDEPLRHELRGWAALSFRP